MLVKGRNDLDIINTQPARNALKDPQNGQMRNEPIDAGNFDPSISRRRRHRF